VLFAEIYLQKLPSLQQTLAADTGSRHWQQTLAADTGSRHWQQLGLDVDFISISLFLLVIWSRTDFAFFANLIYLFA
jgi:hypothetical protein